MLEQRRAEEKGYINLKEAAALAGYTPDYVGQLIRAGKIRGEQVYSNVAWMTTAEEIEAYVNNKQRTVEQAVSTRLLAYGTALLYAVITLLALLFLCLQYVLYVSIDRAITSRALAPDTPGDVEVVSQLPEKMVYE